MFTPARFIALAGVLTLMLSLASSQRAHAATFVVNSTADTADVSPGNGVCADSLSNCTLRAAIQEANSLAGNDTINFSITGTITLDTELNALFGNLTITGPGASLLTVRRNPAGGTPDFRIFTINSGQTASISGLTVTNGKTADGAPGATFGGEGGEGGGIRNGGTLVLTDVIVMANNTGRGGDGSVRPGGGGLGGGIYNTGSLTMTSCLVTANRAGNGGDGGSFGGQGGNGGGIYSETGSLSLTNVIVSDNFAGDSGNSGSGGFGGHGGGIYVNTAGVATLTNCTVSGNTAGNSVLGSDGFSGGINNEGAMTVVGSTISGNTSNGVGGGILNHSAATLTIKNSTISGNQSASGGGIHDDSQTMLTLINCTITNNSPNGVVTHSPGNAHVGNTIIAGNGAPGAGDLSGTFTSQGNNLIGKSDGSTGFINGVNQDKVGTVASPLAAGIALLANNGGATQTHALLSGSPALDAGNNTTATNAGLTTDQRGAGRFANSAGGMTTTVDIGSFEFHLFLEDVADKITNEDTPLSVLFHIGDAVTISSITASSDNQMLVPNANLSISGTEPIRTLLITPAANQFGTANITITVNESGGGTMTDSFMLTVVSVNDAPSFTKGSDHIVNEDAGAQTVLNWATNMNAGPGESGQSLSFLITGNTNPSLFSVVPSVSSSGTLTYTPAANANGSSMITIVLKDDGGTANGGQDTSASQTFNINVTPVNDPPTANSQMITVSEDFTQFITLTGSDVEGSALTFIVTSGPAHGSLTGSGAFRTYTPESNFNGADSFTFKVNDGAVDSAEATVSITVNPVNDAPVNTVPGTQVTNNANTIVFSSVNSNAITVSDVDAGTNQVLVTLSVTNGTLTLGGTAGLTFNTGDGNEDTTMTFTGTISAVNAAREGLTFKPNLGFFGNAFLQVMVDDQGNSGSGGTRSDTDSVTLIVSGGGVFQFSSANFVANERDGSKLITVNRIGNNTQAVSVGFGTFSNSASERRDFTTAVGTLQFAAGETVKTFAVLISLDSFVEGTESAGLTLFNPTGGAVLGSPVVAFLQINDAVPPQAMNPIDETQNFVRQHYHDFLSREPDAAGLDFWSREINNCGTDLACIEIKRINVSAAFYLSIEFQETGFFTYRMFKSAYGDTTSPNVSIPVPIIRLHEFIPDSQRVGFGVQVGIGNWQMDLENNKRAYALEFVARQRFLNAYPLTMTPTQFVDQLHLRSGGVLSQTERDQLIAELTAATNVTQGRASVLRKVADDENLRQAETNRAFVLMQYYGYLRRNPDDFPDSDFRGWEFWLNKLNQFNGNFIHAEMIKAFISSIEYRQRFGL